MVEPVIYVIKTIMSLNIITHAFWRAKILKIVERQILIINTEKDIIQYYWLWIKI